MSSPMCVQLNVFCLPIKVKQDLYAFDFGPFGLIFIFLLIVCIYTTVHIHVPMDA